jgi:ligand-binding sensor domain-containing protein
MIDQKLLGNGDYFNYLGSVITSDARGRWKIKSRISMAVAAFNKKKTLFTSKLDLNLRKKLVESYILNIALLNKVFICFSCSAKHKA